MTSTIKRRDPSIRDAEVIRSTDSIWSEVRVGRLYTCTLAVYHDPESNGRLPFIAVVSNGCGGSITARCATDMLARDRSFDLFRNYFEE